MKTLNTKLMKIIAGLAMTITVNAIAAGGGNGPGNGTGELASQLALKALMTTTNGLSVEEKIYDLWVRAENSVPSGFERSRIWFGLSVANLGEVTKWTKDSYYSPIVSKYQKLVLHMEQVPALMVGEIEIKPAAVYAFFSPTGNYDGNMDPRETYLGYIGIQAYWKDHIYEGRPDLGANGNNSAKPVSFLASGMEVKSPAPVEYRQINENLIVGVRKAIQTRYGFYCQFAKEVMRKEKQLVERYRYFLGVRYLTEVEEEVEVLDHYELANDYGIPGVCEVHYLMKTDLTSMGR